MDTFITPMNRIGGISLENNATKVNPSSNQNGFFKDIFSDAINNVIETTNKVSEDSYKIATGESDDLHTMGINITQAQLATSMVIQIRNRVMDAYNEIMRINL